jgi:polyisoprenoid-binding protein YceI
VFVVWLVTADAGGRWTEDLITDPRAIHFYDRTRLVSQPFATLPIAGPDRSSLKRTYGQLSWGRDAVWDAYYYFDSDTLWTEETLPTPVQASQPLMTERINLRVLLDPRIPPSDIEVDTGLPVTYRIVPEESVVSYGVGELFAGQTYNYAIGVTNGIAGEMVIDLANPAASLVGPITVNIEQFNSDNILRDERIRFNNLESASYPLALFTTNEVVGLPNSYNMGDTLTFEMVGELVVREITMPTTFQVSASIEDGQLVGTTTTQLLMTDFGFDPPDIAGMIATENEVDITFDFVANPVQ